MTYTYEKREAKSPVDETDTTEKAKYIKLNDTAVRAIDGVTTNEAGGYLAWSSVDPSDPNYLAPGPIISATNTDVAETLAGTDAPGAVEGTQWTPPAAGAYVFRRSYVPSTADVDGRTYTYKLGDTDIEKADLVEGVYRADKSGTATTFRYKYVDGSNTYYGESLENNAEFYKFDGTNSVDVDDKKVLTVTTSGDVTPGDAAYYTYAGYYYDGAGNYYKIVLGNDDFRTYQDAQNNEVFDVSATAAQIGAGSTIEVNPLTGAVKSGAVAYQFVKEETIKDATPYLTYSAGNDSEVAKLVAYYAAGDTDESADYLAKQAAADQAAADAQQAYRDYLDAISDEAIAEADYENAVGEYNAAVSRYNQALADWTYANALSEASKKLVDAAKVRADAQIEWDNANDDLNKAEKAVELEATHLQGGGSTGVSPLDNNVETNKSQFSDLISLNNKTATTTSTDVSYWSIFVNDWSHNGGLASVIGHTSPDFDYGNISNSILTSCETYRSKMQSLWGDEGATGTPGTKATSITAASDRLKQALVKFASLDRNSATGADNDVKAYLAELYDARQNLEDLLEEYKSLYDHLETSAGNETELTHLIKGSDSQTFGDKIDAWIARVKQMKKAIEENKSDSQIGELDIDPDGNVVTTPEDATSNRFGLDAIVQDFVIKYNNFIQEDMHDLPAAKNAWKEAVKQYNKDVDTTAGSGGAGDKYTKAIHTDQRKRDAVKDDGDDTDVVYTKNDYEGLTSDGTAKLTSTTATDKWWLTDNSKILVELFAVERPTDGNPSLASYVDSATGELTTNSDPTVVTGENLWKTIGITKDMPAAAASADLIAKGAGNYNFYEAADSDNKTKESVWTELNATTGNTSVNTSSYTKAIIATAKGKGEFTTLVKDQNSRTGTAFNDDNTSNDVPYPTVSALEGKIEDLKTVADSKKTAYTTAQATTKQKDTDKSTAANVATNAQATADNAAAADSSAIKINIYLDDRNDNGDLNWTSALGNGESAQVAEFYYNYILNAGETSDKLIDAVELDSSVGTKDYKNLTFDLNVALDSVQITYDNDQRTITADAATEESFGKKANIVSQTPDEKGIKVTWTPEASYNAPTKVYRVGLTTVTITDENRTVTEGAGDDAVTHAYTYKINVDGVDYYGDSKNDDTTYYATKEGAAAGTYVFAEAADIGGKSTTVTLNVVE